ncbi:MAG: FecR domain-containing protein [Carboxylicivirga sp.]|jgi:ferric-dicitrate binding protein FerR (iron transport regulator)|nr:FecR domain-containing protein [Carboxylicivirga sp.]
MVAKNENSMHTNNKKIANLITRYLKGELSDTDRQVLEKWLEHEDNRRLFEKITNKQNLLSQTILLDKFASEKAWSAIDQKIKPQRSIGRWISYAAAVVVPLILFFAVYQLTNDADKRNDYAKAYEIKPGENRAVLTLHDGSKVEVANADTLIDILKSGTHIDIDSIGANYKSVNGNKHEQLRYNTMITSRGMEFNLVLEDGTRVWMNAESQLRYPERFVGNQREVFVKGEVYLEVAKDSKRPFYVNFNNKRIKVLGTEFNVRSYENETADVVTLLEGSIELDAVQESVILSPDQQAVIKQNDDKIAVNSVDANIYAAWKDGKFVYNNAELESIMRDLARWYQLNIFYQNESMKDSRFSLYTNRYDSIEEMLEILEATNKIKFEIFENNIVIKSIN